MIEPGTSLHKIECMVTIDVAEYMVTIDAADLLSLKAIHIICNNS